MLIRQSKNVFIRIWKSTAYVENQVNHVNRIFRDDEKEFIAHISRYAQNIETLLHTLSSKNITIDREKVDKFIQKLTDLWFVVTGDSEKELEDKDVLFSYSEINIVENKFKGMENTMGMDVIDGEQPWLRSLQLEITSHCNERCIHCYIPTENKIHGESMPIKRIKNIIDEFVSMGGLRIILSGGELFIHKDVVDILNYCRQKDLMIFLQSNLTLIDDSLIRLIKKINVFNMQVSLYSIDPQVHDMITQVKGSWKKTKKNLEALIRNNIPALISCPILKQNYTGYKDMMEYAKSLNLFCYVDYVLLAQNDFCTNNLCTRMTLEQTSKLLDDILDVDPKYYNKIKALTSEEDLNNVEFAQRFNKCSILKNNICISVNGDAYPCPAWQDMVVGNVFNQSLKDIWTLSPKVQELRNIRTRDFKKCTSCNLHNYCDMCMVYNYNENNGNIHEVCTRFCDIAQMLKMKITTRYKSTIKP